MASTQGVQQRRRQPVDPARDQGCRAPVVAPQKPVAMQGPRKPPEEIQATAQDSIIRLERALAFLDESDVIALQALEGSLKRARSQAATVPVQDRLKCEEFVHLAQKRFSQAEVAVTGAVEHRDRMKVEFEEGRRLANLQAEAQNPPAPIPPVVEMEAEIRRLRLREHVHKSVLLCASVCPRFQGLGFYRPCRHSCQESSSHGWRIVRQISKRR